MWSVASSMSDSRGNDAFGQTTHPQAGVVDAWRCVNRGLCVVVEPQFDLGPQSLSELVAQVQWLADRLACVEAQLTQAHLDKGLTNLRKVEIQVRKLYVRELSGTLNIGVTSIRDDAHLAPLMQPPGSGFPDGPPGGHPEDGRVGDGPPGAPSDGAENWRTPCWYTDL